MKKSFWILLVCLLLVCGAALAECAVCGGDSVCDTCGGLGYLTAQAYGSDEMIKVRCPADCDNGVCAACSQPAEEGSKSQDASAEAASTPEPTATPVPTPNGLFLNRGVRETPKPVFDDPEPEEEEEEYEEYDEPEYDDGGSKTITVEVIIGEDLRTYRFTTSEDYLLDALLEENFVEGEEVSWGFNVTIVDGVKANYNRKGEYWVVLEHDGDRYVSMDDSIAYRRIRNGERYAFEMMN